MFDFKQGGQQKDMCHPPCANMGPGSMDIWGGHGEGGKEAGRRHFGLGDGEQWVCPWMGMYGVGWRGLGSGSYARFSSHSGLLRFGHILK